MRNSSLNRSLSKYSKITLQKAARKEMGERANVRPLQGKGGEGGEALEKGEVGSLDSHHPHLAVWAPSLLSSHCQVSISDTSFIKKMASVLVLGLKTSPEDSFSVNQLTWVSSVPLRRDAKPSRAWCSALGEGWGVSNR